MFDMPAPDIWSWSQPFCDICYGKISEGRTPVALKAAHRTVEKCCACGKNTTEGIAKTQATLAKMTPILYDYGGLVTAGWPKEKKKR